MEGFEERKSSAIRSGKIFGSRSLYILLIIIHAVWFGIGVAKLIIGPMYINDCEREEMIPIWLIVDALIPVFFVVGFIPHYKESSNDAMKQYGAACIVVGIIASIGWSICGAVFIYPNWNGPRDDCDKVVAIFSFVSITLNWSVIGIWSQFVGRILYYYCNRRQAMNDTMGDYSTK